MTKKIGAIARPDDILFSADLPKTRSGKIMRRLLKDIAEGRALGDTTTLADPAVVSRLKEHVRGGGELDRSRSASHPELTRACLSDRHIPFQIRIPLQPRHVVRDERCSPPAASGPSRCRPCAGTSPAGRTGVELHVVEHLGHRVAVHQVGDLVALLGQPDVHRVGVAEQVVQVAQDLLVGAGQEDAEDVRLALARPGAARATACPFARR